MTTTTGVDDEQAARPLRKDAARNRSLLVAAAREVFARRGLDATLDDVARHAGVGVGTAYRHFANKYELAAAILDQVMDEIVADARAAHAQEDAWTGLVWFLDTLLARQSADRGLRAVLTGAKDSQRMTQMQLRIAGPVEDLVARARREGSVRSDLATSDIAMIMTMLCAAADLGADAHPDLWRRYLPMLLTGLRPDGPCLPVPPLTADELVAATVAAQSRPATSAF